MPSNSPQTIGTPKLPERQSSSSSLLLGWVKKSACVFGEGLVRCIFNYKCDTYCSSFIFLTNYKSPLYLSNVNDSEATVRKWSRIGTSLWEVSFSQRLLFRICYFLRVNSGKSWGTVTFIGAGVILGGMGFVIYVRGRLYLLGGGDTTIIWGLRIGFIIMHH